MSIKAKTTVGNLAKALWPGIYAIIEDELEKYMEEELIDRIRERAKKEIAPAVEAFLEATISNKDINLVIEIRDTHTRRRS
jgi:histone H3/H4